MKIGIIGLANSGKTTIFNTLTGQNIPVTSYPTTDTEPNIGIVKVPDERVKKLAEILKPKKITFATVYYIDYLGITKGDLNQNKKVIDMIKDTDAVLHVVRVFEDETVVHPFDKIDPIADAETLIMELLISDIELVDKRLLKIQEYEKKGKKINNKEKNVLLKCKKILESGKPLRELAFSEDEKKAIKHLQFISIKPEVIVLNLSENSFISNQFKELINVFEEKFCSPVIPISGKIEMEIAQLKENDRKMFLNDIGVKETAMNRVIRICYEHLGLISFITTGNEIKAWTIKKGTTAHKAAGKVHSDIQKGFIKAEVIAYEDFINVGSMAEARKKGLLRLEGKNYEVKDGDIIFFRFNL